MSVRVGVYLGGLHVVGTLRVLALLDVLHHLPQEGVAVVLVLGHQHLQHEPQAPAAEEDGGEYTGTLSLCVAVDTEGNNSTDNNNDPD
jgi:hypothetical protein